MRPPTPDMLRLLREMLKYPLRYTILKEARLIDLYGTWLDPEGSKTIHGLLKRGLIGYGEADAVGQRDFFLTEAGKAVALASPRVSPSPSTESQPEPTTQTEIQSQEEKS